MAQSGHVVPQFEEDPSRDPAQLTASLKSRDFLGSRDFPGFSCVAKTRKIGCKLLLK